MVGEMPLMTQSVTFKSTVSDEGSRKGNELLPAGIEHTKLIRAHLARSFKLRGEPWNEEGYAWEFQVEAEGIIVSVIVGAVDERWRVQTLPVALLGFLRRRRLRSAVDSVTKAIEGFLKGDNCFQDVYRSIE